MTQAATLAKAVSEFGASAKSKLSNIAASGQPEDQLRGPLETLFAGLAECLGQPSGMTVLVGETSLADLKTRPDYSVTVANALVGFIEVKAPGKGADPRRYKDKHNKEQWDRLKALPNLLYTDGNAFSLWRDGEILGSVVHLDGDVENSGAKLAAPAALLPLIGDFLTWQPIAPADPLALARVAARLCRFLRDEVVEQMSEGSAPLKELAKDWRALLFPNADDAQFADGYAQAITFGLLMAKSKQLTLADGLDSVAKELGKSNTLIGTALRLLTEQDTGLETSLKTMVRVLDVVEWDVIARGDPEAWLYFYESFLAVYDNKLRKLTGSYYTPPQVVQAMVRLCDEALKSPGRFAIADGLANPAVQIADPATGSGTYLLALLRHIAATVEADQGKGAVGPAITEAAKRLYGFELQFGAFAVAQLRLLAEMIDLGAEGVPRLFVTDTLGDPNAAFQRAPGIYGLLSQSQADANEVKRTAPITVVIGNPPYKEKAKGRGGWVENPGLKKVGILQDWQPPKGWARRVTSNAKHLRNLYVYFWRWAAWKVFEQGAGGRQQEPPVAEHLSGMVCFITVSGFLNGSGFQKMRSDLRRDCDDIWVIDCSPEGHQPKVVTRIFEGVQHPVCIVLASRSPGNNLGLPAKVRFRGLSKGRRDAKFVELAGISLGGAGWADCGTEWRAPFLPEFAGGWVDFVPIEDVIDDVGLGVMTGRTWVIAPDSETLTRRWSALIGESDKERRALLFHPHGSGGPTVGKASKALEGRHPNLQSIDGALATQTSPDAADRQRSAHALQLQKPIRYGFRSFDRQWLVPDKRLLNRHNPNLWIGANSSQVYFTALSELSPSSGPAVTLTGAPPDHDHYSNRGGRVFALWKDAAATRTNVSTEAIAALTRAYGSAPDPVDVFAYVAALLANPAYTERFQPDLIRPGLRVPLTADKTLFAEAAKLGREIIWLHSFGERMAEGRPAGPPRLPKDRAPTIPADGAIPSTAADFPNTIDYDPALNRLKIGKGYIDNVPAAVWHYEVSGKQVLKQWFSYRKFDRERPQIGDKRPPSPLQKIQPDHWLPEYTAELLNVINILGMLVDLEPKQAKLLERIIDPDSPLIPASKLAPIAET